VRAAVLDSWAILCYLRGEHDHQRVVDLLADAAAGKVALGMSLVNLTEVLYTVERLWGQEKAGEVDRLLSGFPVEFVPVDPGLARSAAHVKAAHALALGDCFCAALAAQRNATIYTGDPEFRQLESKLRIVWLRQG
jgi:uncharacterized protein